MTETTWNCCWNSKAIMYLLPYRRHRLLSPNNHHLPLVTPCRCLSIAASPGPLAQVQLAFRASQGRRKSRLWPQCDESLFGPNDMRRPAVELSDHQLQSVQSQLASLAVVPFGFGGMASQESAGMRPPRMDFPAARKLSSQAWWGIAAQTLQQGQGVQAAYRHRERRYWRPWSSMQLEKPVSYSQPSAYRRAHVRRSRIHPSKRLPSSGGRQMR